MGFLISRGWSGLLNPTPVFTAKTTRIHGGVLHGAVSEFLFRLRQGIFRHRNGKGNISSSLKEAKNTGGSWESLTRSQ